MHVPPRVIRPRLECLASSQLPTREGTFRTQILEETKKNVLTKEHLVLAM